MNGGFLEEDPEYKPVSRYKVDYISKREWNTQDAKYCCCARRSSAHARPKARAKEKYSELIKSEVILTYLGVGITDGSSWGSMIQAAEKELVTGVWWPLAGVVLAMFFIIYALNVAGDALRDALDPKLVD